MEIFGYFSLKVGYVFEAAFKDCFQKLHPSQKLRKTVEVKNFFLSTEKRGVTVVLMYSGQQNIFSKYASSKF